MTAPQRPLPDAALLAAYQARTQALRLEVEARVARLWRSLGTYRGPQQTQFARDASTLVGAAQRHMATLTVGFQTSQRRALLGRSRAVRVDPRRVTGAAARGGVDPAEVYARPFNLVWRQLHDLPREDGAIEQAIGAGLDRAVQTALTDLQLTKVQTAHDVTEQDDRVTGYRRVLEGPHSCGLCLVASTLLYHRSTLLPIHPGCDCSVEPLYGDHDGTVRAAVRVGDQVVPIADLPDVHERIEQRFGSSSSGARVIPGVRDADGHRRIVRYRDALITHEHGELGPVIAVRGAPFLGPQDI